MNKGNILVVDDEVHISEMLKLRLEANEFSVKCASSGLEALRVLGEDQEIDVVMSDIMMPGIDGIELMKKIKETHPYKEVILITGFASLETAIEAVRLGGFDYIRKPFEDIPSLLHTVSLAVDKKRIVADRGRIAIELKDSNDKLKRMNLMLGDSVNELVMLHHIVESISETLSVDSLIDKFLHNIVEALEFRRVLLFLKNESHSILELAGNVGFTDKPLGAMTISVADKTKNIVKALSAPEPLLLAGIQKNTDDEFLRKITGEDSRSVIFFPLRVRDDAIGILVLESDKQINVRKINSVKLYINHAALIIANAQMYHRLVKINEELKEMDRLKSEFISTVSHELRTPLTTVKEGISMVLEGIVGEINNRQERVLEMSKKDVDRLSKLIEDLLNISRIDAGKVTLERSRLLIKATIDKACSSTKALTKEKGVELKNACPDGLPFVYADENRVMQVLVNLVANAIKFSSEKGVVTITVRAVDADEFIEIDVKDEGVGIAEEDKSKLFQKFSQLNRVYGPGSKGTGLGLAISKELMTMHGGRIWLKESTLGKGSTFSFTLPVYRPGVEEKILLDDNLDAEIKKAKRVNSVFSMAAFKNRGEATRENMISLRDAVNKGLISEEGLAAIYNEKVVLVLFKGAESTFVRKWQSSFTGLLQKELCKKFECSTISYPEDGQTREELLGRVLGS